MWRIQQVNAVVGRCVGTLVDPLWTSAVMGRRARAIRRARPRRHVAARWLTKAVCALLILAAQVTALYSLMALLAPSTALAAPNQTATSQQSSTSNSAFSVPKDVCQLYPIALHISSLSGVAVGSTISNIYNGTGPGNFGWLTWAGSPSEPTLVNSLTPPGDSTTYVNPSNPSDHVLVVGDWVDGRPGVANSSAVRAALTQLETVDIVVPVWDQAQNQGSTSQYHIVGFAQVRLTGFQLPSANTISARYLGSTDCLGTPPPPPPPPPSPFNGATLTLSPSLAGPNVTGTVQTLQASLTSRTGTPLSGVSVQFTVTGANATTSSGTTDANGLVSFTYTGANQGTDTVQATATDANGAQLKSNTATVNWVTPSQTVSTTTIWARFYPNPNNAGNFSATPSMTPSFSEAFPTIDFNPPSGTVPGNTSGVNEFTRPITDVTTDLNGNFTGTIPAQGNGYQAGVGTLNTFDAVFTGEFTVAAAGNVVYNFYTDDGFILGIGNGATRVGGADTNPPPSGVTPFANFPVMGAYNVPTSPAGNQITVNFPAPGTYPFELDYSECCGGQLAVTAATVTATGTQGVPPTGALTLSPNTVAAQPAGNTQSFSVLATYASGAPIPSMPVDLSVVGTNAQQLHATTDSTGHATFTYTGTYQGTDTVQAVGWVSGLATYSGQVTLQWTQPPSPPPVPQTVTQGWIGGPTSQSNVTGVVPITLASGVSLQSGTVSYWPASNPNAVTTLASNVTGSGGATLATLDTTTLANGSYIIELQGTNSSGGQLDSLIDVTVTGDNKPGRVTFNVTDLTVPVAGLPITIGRTYDSLLRGQSGDFGNGWSLTVGSPKLDVNPSTHDVTLTTPNGKRATFYFTPQSTGGLFGFLLTPGYTPESGTFGSLTADGCGLMVVSGGQLVCFLDAQYAPTTYKYTDPYGRVYTMGADGSLKSIVDLDGNTLVFGPTGITSSAGNSVSFARDAQGRITQITDPSGNVYGYSYDANGNLASVSLPGVSTPLSYTYDASHLLLSAKDPRGNTTATSSYYPDGRLQSVTDALGNTTKFSYDLSTNTTTTTNPDGGVTSATYDSSGMITKQVDALGNTTTFSYDSNHNLLTQTDALGHVTTYTYDSQGRTTSKRDALGNTTQVTYDQFGALVTLTDPLGNTRTITNNANALPISMSDSIGTIGGYTWDSQGNALTRTDANGQVTSYTYDAYGNILSQTDPLGNAVHYTYDQLGRVVSTTDARGNITKYTYDALGDVLTVTDALGHVTTYTYDGNGNQTSMKDALGRVTTYTYDALNRQTQITYPDGTTVKYTYDFRGNPLTFTDQAGRVTQYTYDLAGNETSVTTAAGTPDAATTSYVYNAAGHKIKETDPLGHMTTHTYDAAYHLLSSTDPLGRTTTYTYDAGGHRLTMTDPNGHTTHYAYDGRGRLITTTYADGTTTRQTYDSVGNVLTKTDQGGQVTTDTYDADGRLTSVTDPLGDVTKYAYDQNGNLVGITDANGHQTTFAFDSVNQQTKKTWPDGSFETFGYDAVGNQTSHLLTDGHTNSYTYDALDRLTKISYFDGTSVNYTYTPTGQQQTVVDSRGTTSYTYDNQDRVIKITQPNGLSVSYGYDVAGNRTAIATPAGNTTYSYDAANQLASVTDPQGHATTYAYDAAGNPTQEALPNGITVRYGYDTLNRLTSVTDMQGSATMASYTYSLGPVGNPVRVVGTDGSAVAWTYDNAYRLTGESEFNASGVETGETTYAYDAVGNRLSMDANGVMTSYSYNSLDQLVSAATGSQATQYTYDKRGNLTQAATGTSTVSYRYDAADRVAGATLADGTSVSYTYDAAGRRVQQTVANVTTNYLWDEASQYGQLGNVVLETDGTGATQASYVLANGQPISEARSGNTSYYLQDGLGSVRTLTNASGATTDSYSYDAFGNAVSTQGTTTNPYRYRSQHLDTATGLYQLRARYYDPTTGRFLTRDTALSPNVPAELDRYVYARANPISYSDPSGHTAAAGAIAQPVAGGGDIGEYAALLMIAVISIPVLIELGEEIKCIFYKAASVLMAIDHDGAGLISLEETTPERCHIPILIYPKSTPNIWQNIVNAQNSGQPMLLVYNGPGSPLTAANRRAACPRSLVKQMKPLSCDEYPFASTTAGGAGATTMAVPPPEQNAQGGIVGGFYRSNGMGAGSAFAVVPDPDP